MAKYKTKLTEVEAFQYCGHLRDYWGRLRDLDGGLETPKWAIEAFEDGTLMYTSSSPSQIPRDLYVKTLEGDMYAKVGDYIIKGVNGELFPCKPDIFEKTYEKVD